MDDQSFTGRLYIPASQAVLRVVMERPDKAGDVLIKLDGTLIRWRWEGACTGKSPWG
ncbi:hypothetical protein DFAR_680021 [Desulfarculales bacterium]